MKIETDETLVMLVAKDDAEAAMLAPIAGAINADSDGSFPACLVDNEENGAENRIINGILQITIT